MTFVRAIVCEGEGCLAVFLGQPQDGPEGVKARALRLGWEVGGLGRPDVCPACQTGKPVAERGECARCLGRTVDLEHVSRCLYCGHTEPHPADEDEDQEHDEDQEQRAGSAGPRCPAAHLEDPTACVGPVVVQVLDAQNHGANGCVRHGSRLLASLDGARVVGLPDAPAGTAVRVFKLADGIRPFPWLTEAPRTREAELSRAEVRQRSAGTLAELADDAHRNVRRSAGD